MALELNQLVQPDNTARYLWATDKTGEYSASNLNGWGSPNFELAESALGAIAIARDTDRTVFGAVSPRWKFNASALNTDENVFQMTYEKDSIIDVYLIRLMVSYDGIVSVDTPTAVTFQEGNYFYNATEAAVYKIENSLPVLVEDMRELIDALPVIEALDGNTVSVLCSDAYVIKLAVEYSKEYKAYTVKRKEGCDNLQQIFFELLNFKEDIIGARRSYTSGLFSQAQSIIETLTEEKNIQ
jgi:hypothetical protein